MLDPQAVTRATYDQIATAYAQQLGGVDGMAPDRERFAAALGSGALVADIGCGPAHHVRALRDLGLRVVGLDLSEGQLRASDGVPGLVQADMLALPLSAGAVDGIWAIASLLHLPRELAPRAIAEFARVLRSGGQLWLTVAEGEGEGFEPSHYDESRAPRWFSYYSEPELRGWLEPVGFEVAWTRRGQTHRSWLSLHCRRA
ncbi:class I SAM-dependent methyltransferase [Catellatospora tritici]|uniref:class I SAM-dependent methyltransferase n=1 Tax=Catellatospora tritici TaxID=2851566 RepID=UPI001C2D43B9|nr:class I SAM-dependent methyltransferase [Catellatospora tritici]MBV1848894.1 methyltransferase domain-containing protein [Catellatospora tritici]